MTPIEIRPLQAIRVDELKTVMTGYSTREKYQVSKSEQDGVTCLRLELVPLAQPYIRHFDTEISLDDLERYDQLIKDAMSLGCWLGDRLVGLAIAEICHWNKILWIHEFHIAADLHGRGLGRQLMAAMADRAGEKGLRALQVETQNTNVPAIRFYRQVGFEVEAIDLSYYTNRDVEHYEVAIFMRRKLLTQAT
ncbi:MAG TPA: GNAT family N-acetyltransferase [Anaerolineaceae bacterium]|jgi:ribosomal protein S18 acetylase RimI-like enzyme|nr:GNAT family N-acetyltransferase [Anaerolineaceae bacterium]